MSKYMYVFFFWDSIGLYPILLFLIHLSSFSFIHLFNKKLLPCLNSLVYIVVCELIRNSLNGHT